MYVVPFCEDWCVVKTHLSRPSRSRSHFTDPPPSRPSNPCQQQLDMLRETPRLSLQSRCSHVIVKTTRWQNSEMNSTNLLLRDCFGLSSAVSLVDPTLAIFSAKLLGRGKDGAKDPVPMKSSIAQDGEVSCCGKPHTQRQPYG